MKATERLARHGIAFEKHDGRLVIRHSGRVIDFWPERGLWLKRGIDILPSLKKGDSNTATRR